MPKRSPLETTLSSRYLSAICGPSIFTCSASRKSAAPPTWSIWPCVSQIFSTVTPACLIASRIFGTSPPGSITTAFLEGSCQMMVQFCSNSVTGTIIAPALAWVSVWELVSWVITGRLPIFGVPPREDFAKSSFRGDAKHRTRNLEISRCAIAHLRSGPTDHPGMTTELRSLAAHIRRQPAFERRVERRHRNRGLTCNRNRFTARGPDPHTRHARALHLRQHQPGVGRRHR